MARNRPDLNDVTTDDHPAAHDTDPTRAQVVVAPAQPAEILAFVQGAHVPAEQDANEIRMQMAMRASAAQTFEALFARQKPVMSKDYTDRPFTITGVKWLKSRFTDDADGTGLSFWLFIDAVDVNGEPVQLGTSSYDAMVKVFFAERNKIDISQKRVKFIKAERPTERGYYPVFLDTAD